VEGSENKFGTSSERESLQCESSAESVRANNLDPNAFFAGVFRTEEPCGHSRVGSVFSGTLGFDSEDCTSRISLVVGDNPRRGAAQSSNGQPLGTRAAAPEN
jgi:hypothetical protein